MCWSVSFHFRDEEFLFLSHSKEGRRIFPLCEKLCKNQFLREIVVEPPHVTSGHAGCQGIALFTEAAMP